MFDPIRYDSGKLDTKNAAASQTITKGMALEQNSSGLLVPATSSTTFVEFVAMESIVTPAATTPISVIETRGVEFEALTAGTPAQTDEGEHCDLTDANTVNEAASSNDVFLIEHVLDAANKKVSGYFNQKVA